LQLVKEMVQGDVVLVKASRAEKFEELAHAIEARITALIGQSPQQSTDGGVKE
jgi:putative ribosome biogenesis GTPase RsgA